MTKGKGNKNLQEILSYAVKSKRFIGGLCKLEKDGSIRKINGQAFALRITKSGDALLIIDNLLHSKRPNSNKRWQNILVKNILSLSENKWHHEKVA